MIQWSVSVVRFMSCRRLVKAVCPLPTFYTTQEGELLAYTYRTAYFCTYRVSGLLRSGHDTTPGPDQDRRLRHSRRRLYRVPDRVSARQPRPDINHTNEKDRSECRSSERSPAQTI